MMIIVPEQGMNSATLQTKYPIINWEIYTEGTRTDDLVMLWSLVKEKFNSTEPTNDKEREIWVELKRLFESDTDDELWKLQRHIHDLTWKLYDSCGVHHVSTEKGIDIYMLVEKEYPLSRGTLTLMLVAKLLVDQDNEMSRELLRMIFMQVNHKFRGGLLGIKGFLNVTTAGSSYNCWLKLLLLLKIEEKVLNTPMVEKNKLDEDLQGTPVDATLYRGIIGSLMYLTSNRPDFIYAVCLCARYGVLAESVLFLIFDQIIIYGVYTDVDTTYSSKSGNGLEFFKVFRYGIFLQNDTVY
ncbi:hypothetical protein Tco_1240679 [Tanacetum coccineum]